MKKIASYLCTACALAGLLLAAASCEKNGGHVEPEKPQQPVDPGTDPDEPSPEIPAYSVSDFVGKWICTVDQWDLSRDGTCTELGDNGYPVYVNGEKIQMPLKEYCEQFAADYNAAYPGYGITAEDITWNENDTEDKYVFFDMTEERLTFHVCWPMGGGLGHFQISQICGPYEYYPETATMMVWHESETAPKVYILAVKGLDKEAGEIKIAVTDEYPWPVSNFSGTKAYSVYCTAIYTCRLEK